MLVLTGQPHAEKQFSKPQRIVERLEGNSEETIELYEQSIEIFHRFYPSLSMFSQQAAENC